MAKKPKSIDQQLRAAIALAERGGTTRTAIARAAGIDPSQVIRVAEGETVPRLDTAAKILRAIGRTICIK